MPVRVNQLMSSALTRMAACMLLLKKEPTPPGRAWAVKIPRSFSPATGVIGVAIGNVTPPALPKAIMVLGAPPKEFPLKSGLVRLIASMAPPEAPVFRGQSPRLLVSTSYVVPTPRDVLTDP